MTAIEWDKVGERTYQTGIDRGVLYLSDGSGVPWNGLVSLTESFDREVKTFHHDGVKYLEHHVLGDFAAELSAFTYPDEFDEILGLIEHEFVIFHDQPPKRFALSYRTLIGNDISGSDHGYKIHLLYNLQANPSSNSFSSLSELSTPVTFAWAISGTPEIIAGRRPTCHISIDSTKIHPILLDILENTLYGTDTTDPTLPGIADIFELDDVLILDNGDGTWTAVGSSEIITMLDGTTFQIDPANAEYLDGDTYTISSSVEV